MRTHTSPASKKPGIFSPLAVPEYRTLWIGMLFSMLAMQFNIVSRAWLAYHLSGSALALGIVIAARGFPELILAPLSGYVADRLDKRTLVAVSQTVLAGLAVINALLVQFDMIRIWHLAVIGLGQGFVFPFNQLARQAYIPHLVGGTHLSKAFALNASTRNAIQVIAPSIAGVCIAFNPVIAFYAIAAFYIGALLMVWKLPATEGMQRKPIGLLREMTLGFRHSWKQPTLRTITVTLFFIVILGRPYQQLLPIFQESVLHVGPSQLGIMYAVVGIGAIVGAVAVAYLSESRRLGLIMAICGAGFGLSLALFSYTPVFWVSLGFLFLTGLTSQSYLTFNSVLTVLHCDRDVYARVVSVRQMIMSLVTLSTVPMAAIIDLAGLQQTVAGAGVMLAVIVLLISGFMPGITARPPSENEKEARPVHSP